MNNIESRSEISGNREEGDDMPFMYSIVIQSGGDALSKENLTNQINGSSQQFTISESIVSGSLRVYWNGIREVESESFNQINSTTFSTVFTPLNGDTLIVEYVSQS